VAAGECVNIGWSVGGGTTYARILRNGAVVVDSAGFDGQQNDCLETAGEYNYVLEVYNPVDEMESAQESVMVTEAEPENPLAGTRWTATAYWDGSAMQETLEGTLLSMNFGQDGSLNGSAGCNSYSSSYTVDGSSLVISAPSLTNKACPEPEGIAEQETAFVNALSTTSQFYIEAGQLYLLNATDQVIVELISVAR
jgi:heat shock protein HslJ